MMKLLAALLIVLLAAGCVSQEAAGTELPAVPPALPDATESESAGTIQGPPPLPQLPGE